MNKKNMKKLLEKTSEKPSGKKLLDYQLNLLEDILLEDL